jgi:AcrR family transcriptional regulator
VKRTRSDIVQAAVEVFREKGYERATVRDIAAQAGLGSSGLYSHVSSKKELFLEAVAPAIAAGGERMEAIAGSELPADEKLRAAIVGAVEAFDEHYPVLSIYVRELYPVLESADPEQRLRYEGHWTAIVESGIREGVFRPDADPRILVYGILGMINWMHRWYRPDGRRSAAEIGEELARTVLDGVRAPRD